MADDVDVARSGDASVLDRLPMRDPDGEVNREFVEQIARAIDSPWPVPCPISLVVKNGSKIRCWISGGCRRRCRRT